MEEFVEKKKTLGEGEYLQEFPETSPEEEEFLKNFWNNFSANCEIDSEEIAGKISHGHHSEGTLVCLFWAISHPFSRYERKFY